MHAAAQALFGERIADARGAARDRGDPQREAPTASAQASADLRSVFFNGEWHDTPIWRRLDLPVGWTADGPAVLEQPDATIVIEPGYTGEVDELGNIIVKATS